MNMKRQGWKWVIAIMVLTSIMGTWTPAKVEGSISPHKKIYEPEYLGEPLTQTLLLHTALGMEDGHNMLYTTMSGKPNGQFIVYNLDTHTVMNTFELPGVKNSWSHKIDSQGNVYMLPHGYVRVYQYSPVTKQIKQSELVAGETATYGLNMDENDNVYFGTFPSAKVIKYNPVTNELTDFGTIFPGQKYVMSMVYHEGFLYAGGQDQNSMFVKINVATGEKTPIPNPNTPDLPAGFKPISYYMMSIVDNLIFAQIKAENGVYYMCIYDINQQKWVKAFARSFGHYVSPKLDGKVYLLGGLPSDGGKTNALYAIDMTTLETEDTGIRYFGNYTGGGWVELKNRPDLPGKSLVTVQNGMVLAFNLATRKAEFLKESNFPAIGIHIQDLEAGPDNKLIMGGYMLDNGVIYDTETGASQEFATTQTEAIKRIGNKVYLGCYTQATLYELDLAKPIGPTNPRKLAYFGTELQDRIFDIVEADGKIVMGTYPRAGFQGGGIAIYDLATGASQFYKNIIPDQSVEGLAYKDGKVYGSTSIFGGSFPTQKEAKVFIFDMATRQVVKEIAPQIKGVEIPLTLIGDIEFGPDGNLWGISTGAVFALDPVTLDTVKAIIVDKISDKRTLPTIAHMIFGEDGLLYTNANGFFAMINPFTLEYRKTPIKMTYPTIATDGNVYYTGFSSDTHKLYRMTVSELAETEYSAISGKLNDSVVLYTGQNGISANGKAKLIDPANKHAIAIAMNSETLVPSSFFTQAMNARVEWTPETQSAVIHVDGKVIRIKVGESQYSVDGKMKETEVPAQMLEQGLVLPLKSLVKSLGKFYFKDNDGLVVISDDVNLLNKGLDKELIDDMKTYISKDVPRLLAGFNKEAAR